MNCSFCASAVVAAIMPADTIAAPSSAILRNPIVSSSLIGLDDPCGRPCVETLKHIPTCRNHFPPTKCCEGPQITSLPRLTGEVPPEGAEGESPKDNL